jgi:hypothetical protein
MPHHINENQVVLCKVNDTVRSTSHNKYLDRPEVVTDVSTSVKKLASDRERKRIDLGQTSVAPLPENAKCERIDKTTCLEYRLPPR